MAKISLDNFNIRDWSWVNETIQYRAALFDEEGIIHTREEWDAFSNAVGEFAISYVQDLLKSREQ